MCAQGPLKRKLGSARTWVRLAGILVMMACFGGILAQLRTYGVSTLGSVLSDHGWFLAGSAIVFAACSFLLCEAFFRLLGTPSPVATRSDAWCLFGLSQIGKYVPGNVFHLVGRQGMGKAAGIGHAVLIKASTLELFGLALAAACFAPLLADAVPSLTVGPIAALAGTLLTLGVAGAGVRYLLGGRIAAALMLQATFLGATAALFAAVAASLGAADLPLHRVVGAYVVSWLIGFVTPGAPAGVGVRDYALVALLGQGERPEVVLAVVAFRVVNIAADVLLFCAALGTRYVRREPLGGERGEAQPA